MIAQPMPPNHINEEYPLAFAPDGEMVELVALRAGRKLKKRLADLGLGVGMQVRVMGANSNGPLILAVQNDSRIALGRSMAHKITVRPVYKE